MWKVYLSYKTDLLQEGHFLILYWSMIAEDKEEKYNITNAFDDLKAQNLTRTKQNVMSYIEALKILNFLLVKEERNKKNLYLTKYGGQALADLVNREKFKLKQSIYLGG